jgi:hypothetical protein
VDLLGLLRTCIPHGIRTRAAALKGKSCPGRRADVERESGPTRAMTDFGLATTCGDLGASAGRVPARCTPRYTL